MSETAITEILAIGDYVSTIRRHGHSRPEWIGTQELIAELNQQLGRDVTEDIQEIKNRL